MRNRGRLPAFRPTEEQRELVSILTAGGITQDVICRHVKNPATGKCIGTATLQRHFRDEIDLSKNVANARLVERAYQMAIAGEKTMLIFLLKTRMGYKEPAQDILLHKTWGELVQESASEKLPRPALAIIEGGKGKATSS